MKMVRLVRFDDGKGVRAGVELGANGDIVGVIFYILTFSLSCAWTRIICGECFDATRLNWKWPQFLGLAYFLKNMLSYDNAIENSIERRSCVNGFTFTFLTLKNLRSAKEES